jgi:hypothetical protein
MKECTPISNLLDRSRNLVWHLLAIISLLCISTVEATAQRNIPAEIAQVQGELNAVRQEQQSVYQQFEMIQGLKQDELYAQNPPVIENSPIYSMDNPPPNYDDMVREKRERQERIDQYTSDANALYARYRELEQHKRSLHDRLRQLREELPR